MTKIDLKLTSIINRMPHEKFVHLYFTLMKITQRYVSSSESKGLDELYELMEKSVERVELLNVKQNGPSDTIAEKNVVYADFKSMAKLIVSLLQAIKLSPLEEERAHAAYAYEKLKGMFGRNGMSSMNALFMAEKYFRHAMEEDEKLANALAQLDMMKRVEMLYKLGEEVDRLLDQYKSESAVTGAIDKLAIRKEAANKLRTLFDYIELQYAMTDNELWVMIGKEMKRAVKFIEK